MANPRSSKLTALFAALETTPGTYNDPTTDPTNVLKITDFTIDFISSNAARDFYKTSFGKLPDVVTQIYAQISFTVELHGEGIDANNNVQEPRIGKLIEGCGFKKYTTTADVDSDTEDETSSYYYLPVSAIWGSSDFKTLSFAIYHGKSASNAVLYKLKGAVGNMSFTGTVGSFPTLSFTFTGVLEGTPTDAAFPSTTYSTVDPNPWQGCDLSFDSQTFLAATRFEFNMNNVVAPRIDFQQPDGLIGFAINDRNPTGALDPEACLVSDYDMFSKFKNGQTVALSIGPLGDDTNDKGNIIKITAPAVQVTDYAFGDRDGILTWELPLKFCTSSASADDEIKIIFAYTSEYAS